MEVAALPYRNPDNYVHVSERVAAERAKTEPNGALWANQWDNTANRNGHYKSTGPEIWKQTEGTIDGFTCAIGTGGTLAGTSSFLKEKNKDIVAAVSDPMGDAMYNYVKHGELKSEGRSIT